MVNLTTEFCNLKLKNPLISAAGPNTKNFESVKKGIDAGCGAVVVRSLHLQYPDQKKPASRGYWRVVNDSTNYLGGQYSFQSGVGKAERINMHHSPGVGGCALFPSLEEWRDQVRRMVEYASGFDCRIIASIGLCGSSLSTQEVWEKEAVAMAEAGVDAIQLHTAPSPKTDTGRRIQSDPEMYLAIPIKIVKSAVPHMPVIAKLPLDTCDTVTAAMIAEDAGADAVTVAGRWMSLLVEETEEGFESWNFPAIGGPWSLPILLAQVGRMKHPERIGVYHKEGSADQDRFFRKVKIPVMISGGVRFGKDVVSAVAAGASAVELCSQILLEGYPCIDRILKEMETRLSKRGVKALDEIKDTLKYNGTPPQMAASVDSNVCIGCGRCVSPCLNDAISLVDGKAVIDASRCEGCRSCFHVCPKKAVSMRELY